MTRDASQARRRQPALARRAARLAALLLLAGALPASAADPLLPAPPGENPPHRGREIIAHIDHEKQEKAERDHWLANHFHIRKRWGLEYRHSFQARDHRMILSIQGPAMPRKRLGLSFELRF